MPCRLDHGAWKKRASAPHVKPIHTHNYSLTHTHRGWHIQTARTPIEQYNNALWQINNEEGAAAVEEIMHMLEDLNQHSHHISTKYADDARFVKARFTALQHNLYVRIGARRGGWLLTWTVHIYRQKEKPYLTFFSAGLGLLWLWEDVS